MTPTETIRYLEAGGFFGARVVDGNETVFLRKGAQNRCYIDVYVGEQRQRSLSTSDFCEQFSNVNFRKVQPTEVLA